MNIEKAKTGLIFAMEEEQTGLQEFIENQVRHRIGKREFIEGILWGHPVVCVLSGIGKVAASSTSTTMINHFKVDQLLLTGVAGACNSDLHVGDIVIASELLQHDMDASPLFPRFEVPLSGKSRFKSSSKLNKELDDAIDSFLNDDHQIVISESHRTQFGLNKVKKLSGLIASGDQFISSAEVLNNLVSSLNDVMAVEMEGAAIAQVCHDYDLPFAIVRTISDNANDAAHIDFPAFVKSVAAPYSIHILKQFFKLQDKENCE